MLCCFAISSQVQHFCFIVLKWLWSGFGHTGLITWQLFTKMVYSDMTATAEAFLFLFVCVSVLCFVLHNSLRIFLVVILLWMFSLGVGGCVDTLNWD